MSVTIEEIVEVIRRLKANTGRDPIASDIARALPGRTTKETVRKRVLANPHLVERRLVKRQFNSNMRTVTGQKMWGSKTVHVFRVKEESDG